VRLSAPLDDALRTASHVRVLRTLFNVPLGVPASGRELARRAGLSHPTATKVLRDLEHQGLVRVQRQVGAEGYRLNERNLLVQPLKELFDREEAIPVRLTEWLKAALEDHSEIEDAYLFGSAARGSMTSASDLDLGIVAPGARAEVLEERLDPLISDLRQRVGVPVQVVITTKPPSSLRAGRKRLWQRIVKEGLVITSREMRATRRGRRTHSG
jgi:predicted nucleotidyltransferase